VYTFGLHVASDSMAQRVPWVPRRCRRAGSQPPRRTKGEGTWRSRLGIQRNSVNTEDRTNPHATRGILLRRRGLTIGRGCTQLRTPSHNPSPHRLLHTTAEPQRGLVPTNLNSFNAATKKLRSLAATIDLVGANSSTGGSVSFPVAPPRSLPLAVPPWRLASYKIPSRGNQVDGPGQRGETVYVPANPATIDRGRRRGRHSNQRPRPATPLLVRSTGAQRRPAHL